MPQTGLNKTFKNASGEIQGEITHCDFLPEYWKSNTNIVLAEWITHWIWKPMVAISILTAEDIFSLGGGIVFCQHVCVWKCLFISYSFFLKTFEKFFPTLTEKKL